MGSSTDHAAGEILRHLPQVDRLLADNSFTPLIEEFSRAEVLGQVREVLEDLRKRAVSGQAKREEVEVAAIARRVRLHCTERAIPYYRPVINATGVVLHTGLGRPPRPLCSFSIRSPASAPAPPA